MTLRLRLLLSVVAIVAVGLVISDVVTFNALRSFLVKRVDQQLEAAAFPVGRALLSSTGSGPGGPVPGVTNADAGRSSPAPGPGGPYPVGGPAGLLFRHPNGRAQPRDAARDVLVPPGTYGEIRNARGVVKNHLFFSYGGKVPSPPVIPARLPGSGLNSSSDSYFSTSSSGPSSVGYRAVAKPLVGGNGVIVIAVPLTEVNDTLHQLVLIELIVSAVLLAGLGALSWVMVRRDLRPLEEITDTAGAIAAGDLSPRLSEGMIGRGTEVAQLGRAFNTMLDEIQRAFEQRAVSEERLRRFLADASHELRTPLTSILGYTELFDLGVRDRPAELAASMHHIRDEATRMGTLVDELFLLAQLDRERPLRLEAVDLQDIVRRSVENLSVADPEHPVTLQSSEPVWVNADRARLRQVVDNLVVNGQRHAPSGSAVAVRVAHEGDVAVLVVHDEGPGVAPGDVPHVFEPFFRADPSRSRRSGGAGLGLAIVAAIVAAHRGTVEIEPAPGATLVVRLPVALPVSDGHDAGTGNGPADGGGPGAAIGTPSAATSASVPLADGVGNGRAGGSSGGGGSPIRPSPPAEPVAPVTVPPTPDAAAPSQSDLPATEQPAR